MKNYKIKHFFYLLVIVIDIALVVILSLFIFQTASQNEEKELTFIQEQENKIEFSLSSTIENTQANMISSLQSMNYLVVSNCSNPKKLNRYAPKVTSRLRNVLFEYSEVEGFFLYNSACDAFFPCYRWTSFTSVKDRMLSLQKDALKNNRTNFWFVEQIDGVPCIFYLTQRRYGSVMVMINPKKNSRYLEIKEYLQTDEEITFDFFHTEPDIPQGYVSSSVLIKPAETLFLIYAAAKKSPLEAFSRPQWILFFILFILLTLVQVAFLLFQKFTYKPLRQISDSLQKIAEGDLEHRVTIDTDIYEIQQLSDTINQMLDKIDSYKTDSFNQRMDAVQAKLQYLQLQIRPHFFKNCLKNVYSLIDLGEYEKANQTVLSLSDYIGFTFQNVKGFIPLQAELQAVQSYINLCNILRNDIKLHYSLDTACLKCNFLPMSVLTFVENSLKHRHNTDLLHLTIQADLLHHEVTGKLRMRVIIQDNGGGFPEEILTALRQADVSQLTYKKQQVGISNVRYRFWLIYGENAEVTFENSRDGAIVTITLPYETA